MSKDKHCANEDLSKLEHCPESSEEDRSESSEYSDESDETSVDSEHFESIGPAGRRKRQVEEASKSRLTRGGWWHAGTASSSTTLL